MTLTAAANNHVQLSGSGRLTDDENDDLARFVDEPPSGHNAK